MDIHDEKQWWFKRCSKTNGASAKLQWKFGVRIMEWKMYGGRSEVRCRYGCACCGTCVACYLACCCIRMLLSTLWCTALRHTSRAHATRGGLAATCKSQHAGGHLRKMHHHSTRQGKNPIRQANWVQHCI
jgi:hypothetical protein